MDYDDRPNPSDFAEEDFERHRKQHYPRGYGPPHNSPDDPDPEMDMYDEHDPSRYVDPGYGEDHSYQDPDDWHHDQKSGGIVTQRDQWPDRVAGIRQSAHGRFTEDQLASQASPRKPPVGGDVHRVTGLYGEDEDDPYDVYAKPGPDGKGWDVIRPVGR